jgi:hypothetical protein
MKGWEFTFNLTDKGKDALNGAKDLRDRIFGADPPVRANVAAQGSGQCSTGR